MAVTSPAIASHAGNQPSQSGAGIGARAAAHSGLYVVALRTLVIIKGFLVDEQIRELRDLVKAESKGITLQLAAIVAALQATAVCVLMLTRRKQMAVTAAE
jgi:hypothetical protein